MGSDVVGRRGTRSSPVSVSISIHLPAVYSSLTASTNSFTRIIATGRRAMRALRNGHTLFLLARHLLEHGAAQAPRTPTGHRVRPSSARTLTPRARLLSRTWRPRFHRGLSEPMFILSSMCKFSQAPPCSFPPSIDISTILPDSGKPASEKQNEPPRTHHKPEKSAARLERLSEGFPGRFVVF